MVTPKELDQINNHLGQQIHVDLRNGNTAVGTLSFFNWEQQIVHLSNFEIIDESGNLIDTGKFYVINQRDWGGVRIK